MSDPELFGRHVAELNATNNSLVRAYIWGLDLSETLDGAGGVGGLLWVRVAGGAASGTHFVCYDGNGNVWNLVSASTGSETARYEYSPFGEPLRQSGVAACTKPFRFSTKRTEDFTGLVLYEYRAYNPTLGRWLSRDPIYDLGQRASGNRPEKICPNDAIWFYVFVGNNSICAIDLNGLITFEDCSPAAQLILQRHIDEACRRINDASYGCCMSGNSLARQVLRGQRDLCRTKNFRVKCLLEPVPRVACAWADWRKRTITTPLTYWEARLCDWPYYCIPANEFVHLAIPEAKHPTWGRVFNRVHACLGCDKYSTF
ncbi:RHS repeat domain-containing protein [Limisphaera sp. 4302-co]